MQLENSYMSEMFRIINGALRLDSRKVVNYAEFLADKLEANGDKASAVRLRQLLSENEHQLHPAKISSKALPVDSETRFPLVEDVALQDPSDPPLILSDDQQNLINEFVSVAKSQAQFEIHGVSTPMTLLVYGPPGCGKNRLAREIARNLGLKLYMARLDGLISSYLGSTAKNIRAIFDFVEGTPCVLFLDEFDAIAKLRDDAQELGELKRVVNSFLQNLDSIGTQCVVIAATNHHQLLDAAVWRRFGYRLEFKHPSEEVRSRMWKEFLDTVKMSDHEVEILSDLSEGFSGADIRDVCLRLRRQAIIAKAIPSLKDAFIGLKRLASGDAKNGKFILGLGDHDSEIAKSLKQRNPKLYSSSSLASLLDTSKATANRWAKKEGAANG
jgi:SpoVK/Ycf46/Vps4 family AAA+-type ATPase